MDSYHIYTHDDLSVYLFYEKYEKYVETLLQMLPLL